MDLYGIFSAHFLEQMIQTAQQAFNTLRVFAAAEDRPGQGIELIQLKIARGLIDYRRRDGLDLVDK